jgi:4-amino-4-deoxy-L-arabinose transferase-like glycosyltransferase
VDDGRGHGPLSAEAGDPTSPAPPAPEPEPSHRTGWARRRRRLRSVPVAVWGATALFVAASAAWALLVPVFHAPDEPQHVDLIGALAHDPAYPAYDGRRMGPTTKASSTRWLDAGGGSRAPRLGERPRLVDPLAWAGLDAPGANAQRPGDAINQMPQHPPLYYELGGVALRVERALHPGAAYPSLPAEVLFLRFWNVALMASLPLAGWALVRALGGDDRTGIAAAVALVAVPQLTHIAGSVNNDDLLVPAAAWLAVAVARVAREGPTVRRSLAVGALLGLALLTKAFAFLLIPWVVAAYALGGHRRRREEGEVRRTVSGLAVAGGLSALLGGWFWLSNLVSDGTLAPTTFFEQAPTRPRGQRVDEGFWLRQAWDAIPTRFWGSFGRYAADLPRPVVLAASALLAVLLVLGLLPAWRWARRVLRPVPPGLARGDLVLALVPAAVLGAYLVQHAHSIYVRTTWTSFLQGRYLFAGITGLAAVAAVGLDRIAIRTGEGRRGPGPRAVLVVALAMQLLGARAVLDRIWGGAGVSLREELDTALAWSPWPRALVLAIAAVGTLGAVAGAVAVWLGQAGGGMGTRRPPDSSHTAVAGVVGDSATTASVADTERTASP